MSWNHYVYQIEYLSFPLGPIRRATFTTKSHAEAFYRENGIAGTDHTVYRSKTLSDLETVPEPPVHAEVKPDGTFLFPDTEIDMADLNALRVRLSAEPDPLLPTPANDLVIVEEEGDSQVVIVAYGDVGVAVRDLVLRRMKEEYLVLGNYPVYEFPQLYGHGVQGAEVQSGEVSVVPYTNDQIRELNRAKLFLADAADQVARSLAQVDGALASVVPTPPPVDPGTGGDTGGGTGGDTGGGTGGDTGGGTGGDTGGGTGGDTGTYSYGIVELPRAVSDLAEPVLSGNVVSLAAGQGLQAALDAALDGDVIELAAGDAWGGTFKLRSRVSDGGVVTVRSSRYAELPEGTRVTLADLDKAATLKGGAANAITLQALSGAEGWRFVGIDFALNDGVSLPALVTAIVSLERGSARIVFDRCFFRGIPHQSLQRAIALNSGETAIVNCYTDEIHAVGTDCQAICGWNGTGPYLIENNYLQGSGENIMFGGAAVGAGVIPADITIRNNLIQKPAAWRDKTVDDWAIKNLIELKMAQRVLIEDNILDGSWADAQEGYACIYKSENRDMTNHPEYHSSDITHRRNTIVNCNHGVAIDGASSVQAHNPTIHTERVLVEDGTMSLDNAFPRAVLFLGGPKDVYIHQVPLSGRIYFGASVTRLAVEDSCLSRILGNGVTDGYSTWTTYAKGTSVFVRNRIYDASSLNNYSGFDATNVIETDGDPCA